MVNFPSRRRGARRTPEPVERRLDRLLADPLYSARSDNEFQDYITRQFDRVFGTDPMEVDASGRGIDPPPLRTDIEPFRPRVRADDLRLGAPVGRGAANGFADVLGLQKVLSRLGAYDFDIAEGERSGEARPRLVQAIQSFQKDSGLKVDGLINPAGPTIETLEQNLFGQGKAPAAQRESAESKSTRPTLLSGAQAKGPQTAHAPSQGQQAGQSGPGPSAGPGGPPPVQLDSPVPNPTIRAQDDWGAGHFGAGRDSSTRTHNGVDLVANPGASVTAPVSGEVKKTGQVYSSGVQYDYVEIKTRSDHTVRVFYVSPDQSMQKGTPVVAGKTTLGSVQDLTLRYKGITNHVHVELRDPSGRIMDPTPLIRGLQPAKVP